MEGASREGHIPVMLNEMLAAVNPQPGDVVVDATFGAGGYSRALLKKGATVYAIDRDPNTRMLAEALARDFPGHFFYIEGAFGYMHQLLAASDIHHVDAVVMDIGVSSMQLNTAERGFSFHADGPLDMRMSVQGASAADLVNTLAVDGLARILREYGEEKQAKKIARAIGAARERAPIVRTGQLAALIESSIGKSGKIHPATRSFQALRIAVNDELGELQRGLEAALQLLQQGGRLVVISFHSLEDRIVKQFMQKHSGKDRAFSRYDPASMLQTDATQHNAAALLNICKPVFPSDAEMQANPRARSAVLRAAQWVAPMRKGVA